MDFSYVGSGVINFHGCSQVEIDYFYNFKFGIGAKVYDRISALKGSLESCVVRKAWFVCDPRTAQRKVLYKDGNNWLHNEYDLCSHAEAVSIVTAYYTKKQMDVDRVLSKLNC